jgi:hypothetical protein
LPSTKGREGSGIHPYKPPESVQPTEGHVCTGGVCSWLAKKVFRSDARAVLKIVGEFLKSCGNKVQVNCPFSPVLELFHWKAKMGWICGARKMQKNASLKSRKVKNFALARIRPKSMYGFETTRCKVTVSELTAWRWSVKMLLDPNLDLVRNVVLPLANRNSSWL